MKKYDAIFFDLDGTLLPMDNRAFTEGYLGMLCKAVAHLGYTPKELVGAMWQGVGAMMKNDGLRKNYDAFWETFSRPFGEKVYADIPVFDAFYEKEFCGAVRFTQPTELAVEAVRLARAAADKVILATNPLFPTVAVRERLRWTGLSMEDFDYVTDYSNSSFCKPNPRYYMEIAEKCGVDLTRSLMVGNNAEEDAKASMAAGMQTYLVTDCLIAEGDLPDCPKGSMADLLEFLR